MTQDLRLKENTHVLKRPTSSAAVAEEGAMPKECLTRHYCQMTYDSILYNKESAQKDPALLITCVVDARGEEVPFTTECRLCGAPEADTRAHIYHTCRETATAREQLHAALTATVSKTYGIGLVGAGNAATAVLARRDYLAGQVTAHARQQDHSR
jgi:hypothetical protein